MATERIDAPEREAPLTEAQIAKRLAELEERRQNRIQTTALTVLATLATLTAMYVAKLALVVLLVSILIAFILAPVSEFLQRLRIPRSISSLFAVLLLCAAIGGVTYLSYNRAVAFAQDLPRYSGKIKKELAKFRKQAEEFRKTTENVLPEEQTDKSTIKVQQTTSWSDRITQGAANVTETLLMIGFIPFLVYFMLSWQEHVRSATVMLFKMESRNTAYVTLGLISAMIRTFIAGNFAIGLFMSAISIVVFGILGLPYFYFIGAISGFLSLVPYLGVLLAIVPPIIIDLGNLSFTSLVTIVVTVFGLHVFAINVLYPKIIGKRLQLNPLAVTIALLFWGWLWGAMGLILAVPMVGAMKIIFDNVERLRPLGTWLGE